MSSPNTTNIGIDKNKNSFTSTYSIEHIHNTFLSIANKYNNDDTIYININTNDNKVMLCHSFVFYLTYPGSLNAPIQSYTCSPTKRHMS